MEGGRGGWGGGVVIWGSWGRVGRRGVWRSKASYRERQCCLLKSMIVKLARKQAYIAGYEEGYNR